MNEETYVSRVERLYARVLKERMEACLEKLAAACAEAGYEVRGPFDNSTDNYEWFVEATGDRLREPVALTLTFAESLDYGDLDGVNLALDIVATGGEILGGMTPYNYTPECWVALEGAGWVRNVVTRLQLIEEADPESAVALIDEFAKRVIAR